MIFGVETGSSRRRAIAAVLALAALALTGCRTYYGYDDIVEGVETARPNGEPRNVRYYAVLTGREWKTRVKCFRQYTLPRRTLVERRIVGRRDFYSNFEGDYYLDQPPYNWGWNRDAWLLPQMPFLVMQLGAPDDFLYHNPLMYAIPGFGQLILVCDVAMFAGAGCVDLCLLVGRSLCSGCTIAGTWLGGRLFGWAGAWNLRKHKPGVLRMTSYMPFINLFCAFQTPPYMPMRYKFAHIYGEDEKFAVADQTVLARKIAVRLTPEQVALSSCKVSARVLCGGKLCGEREYTADADGVVDLTELLCRSAATASDGGLTLEFDVRDVSGRRVLTRRVDLTVDQVMPRMAVHDLRAYRDAGTDCLNKLLLSRRSHEAWKQDLFDGEFAFVGGSE